jgi:hypothetical protein
MSFKFTVISSSAGYTLTRNVPGVDEGSSFTITLATTGVQNGQAIPYAITGIQQADISEPLTGTFVVQNGQSNKTFNVVADTLTEGAEIFTLTLSDVTSSNVSVTINDTSTAGDPYFSSVSLLMHMDGTNGSTTFTDVKSHSLTAMNSPTISTAQKKYGTASGSFNGSNTLVSIAATNDLNLSSGDFTIEAFIRPTALGGIIIGSRHSSGTAFGNFNFNLNYPTNNMSLTGTSDAIIVQGSIAGMATNSTWYHVAATKSGTTWRLFLDGVQVGTAVTAVVPYNSSGHVWTVGGGLNVGNPYGVFNGYIDEVRVTKGVARYIAGFTPPTAAFLDA